MDTGTDALPHGKRIERRRLEMEMSRAELATRARLSYQHVYAIESGLKRGSDLALRRIARALHVEHDAIEPLSAA